MKELEAELIGSFDLIDTARISTLGHLTDAQISAAYIHEEGHRKLVSSTAFGEVQQVLAYLNKYHSISPNIRWISNVSELLRLTISNSFYTHEGFAVFRQIYFSNLFKQPAKIVLSSKYKDALKKYQSIATMLPNALGAARIGLVHAIAEAALNSNILSIVEPGQSFESLLRNHLQGSLNQPDYRLDVICNAVKQSDLVMQVETELLTQFEQLKMNSDIQAESSLTSFLEHVFTSPSNSNLALYNIWLAAETDFYFKLIVGLSLPFTMHNPFKMQETIESYHLSLKKFLESYDISIFGKRKLTRNVDSLLQSDNVEYLPDKKISEFVIPMNEAVQLVENLIADRDLFFIIELAIYPTSNLKIITDHDKVYTLYLSIVGLLETSQQKHKRVSLHDDQLALYCFQMSDLERMLNIIGSRVLACAIDWVTFIASHWTIPPELAMLMESNKAQLLIVRPGTSSENFLNDLRIINKLGIINGTVFYSNDRLLYFYFELHDNIKLVVKCTMILFNILLIHRLPEWPIIEPCLDLKSNFSKKLHADQKTMSLLRLIASVDQSGIFIHHKL